MGHPVGGISSGHGAAAGKTWARVDRLRVGSRGLGVGRHGRQTMRASLPTLPGSRALSGIAEFGTPKQR